MNIKLLERLIERLKNGEQMALISDAGTPGISDPGFLIARACIKAGLKIECPPGATAFVPALIKSGLPSDRFVFEGFLPAKKRQADDVKKTCGRRKNNDLLRVSLQTCQNLTAV